MTFCFHTLVAQQKINTEQLIEDYNIFQNILEKGHPALYEYVEQKTLDSVFDYTANFLEKDSTDLQLFKKIITTASYIKDSHLSIFPPKKISAQQNYFPLLLKIINTQFYTDTEAHKIPLGSRIDSINGRSLSSILKVLKKYVPADGCNVSKKYRNIEMKFGAYYTYEYDIAKEFKIVYTDSTGISNRVELPAKLSSDILLDQVHRSSYFAKYYRQQHRLEFSNSHIGQKEPFIYYKNDLKTAVLTVHSFQHDIKTFKTKLTQLFKEIKKNKTKHLIIDVRQNTGGSRPNAVHLFSLITDKNFRQQTSSYVASIHVPKPEYVKNIYLNEDEFLTQKFKNQITIDGWELKFDNLEAFMVSNKDRFDGKVYVLTSGSTLSEASSFALLAKNDPDILVVGEETGGGYYFHTGEFPVYYELPNSKISFILFMEKLTHYVKDTSITKGSGVPPDRSIQLTKKDLVKGTDTQLDYIFTLIKG